MVAPDATGNALAILRGIAEEFKTSFRVCERPLEHERVFRDAVFGGAAPQTDRANIHMPF
jgi:hypothetical protein